MYLTHGHRDPDPDAWPACMAWLATAPDGQHRGVVHHIESLVKVVHGHACVHDHDNLVRVLADKELLEERCKLRLPEGDDTAPLPVRLVPA